MKKLNIQTRILFLKLDSGEDIIALTYNGANKLGIDLLYPMQVKQTADTFSVSQFCPYTLNNHMSIGFHQIKFLESASDLWADRYEDHIKELGVTPSNIRHFIQLKLDHRFDLPEEYKHSYH